MTDRGWGRSFDDPIIIAGRRPLKTLRDVAKFLMGMSPRERIQPYWLDAIEALVLVVEHNGPTMFTRIGIMRALNHGKPDPVVTPRRKPSKRYMLIS